jgi:hypothetical protein
MIEKHLNGSRVGSGTQIAFTAPGMSATDDGSKTTFDLTKLINYAEVSITAAEMLAIRATPKALVAAPGAGYVLEFVSAVFIYDYVAAFTETADNLAIRYTNGSGTVVSLTLETTGLLDATADKVSTISPLATDVLMTANAALVLHNTGDGEFGGTGSPCRVKIAYRVHATGL